VKVFLSWSGEYSKHIATGLRDWLPQILNEVDPFVSTSIEAGARWQSEIAAQLEEALFGIVIVTAQNQSQPWLNFEAGAIAKAVDNSRLVPLAVDLRPTDVKLPLGQFQAQPLDKGGVAKVVESMNAALSRPLTKEHLTKAMDLWWPDLEKRIGKAKSLVHEEHNNTVPQRTERDLLEEILNTVRQIRIAEASSPAVPAFSDTSIRARARELEDNIAKRARQLDVPPPRFEWYRDQVVVLIDSEAPPSLFRHANNLGRNLGFAVNFAPPGSDVAKLFDTSAATNYPLSDDLR
jgi:hypothetical protein